MKFETSPFKIYHCTLEVRGYELDSFGHVNHAAYVNYLEYARWQMLFAEGITLEKITAWKRWPVIAQIELTYLKPAYMGEKFEITTQVVEHGKTNFVFEQIIKRGETTIVRARIRSVIVNELGRPAEMPKTFTKILEKQIHG